MNQDLFQQLADSSPGRRLREAPCLRFDLWCLEVGDAAPVFLYGRVIARRELRAPTRSWSRSSPVLRYRIVAWTMEAPPADVLGVLQMLLEGIALTSILSVASGPTYAPALRLPTAELSPSPTSYQLTHERNLETLTVERSAASPIEDSLARCAAAVRISKASLFAGFEADAKKVIEHLSSLVGLNMAAEHASRLGNLEFLDFPSANHDERSRVDLEFEKSSIAITVNAERLPAPTTLFVRCSERASGRILTDQLRVACVDGSSLSLKFPMNPDGPWTCYVDIWLVSDQDTPAKLWASHMFIPIRDFNVSTRVLGGMLASPDWLEEWSKPDDRSGLSVSLLSLQQREQQPAARARPPWALAEHSARDVAALLSPPKGRDRFLHSSEARLTDRAFEDLLIELSPSETATIVLVDPWIDELGLELLGKGGPHGAVIHVLTSCLLGQEERISRLRSFLRAAAGERPPTIGIGVVRIEAAAIVPPERYLLMVDEGGSPLQGFQLSRSLSLDEVSRPLLLNEIHRSVLPHVVEFAKQLRRCEPEIAGPGAVYETIWPEPPAEVVRAEQALSPEKLEVVLDQLADPADDAEFDRRWAIVSDTLASTSLTGELLLREIPGLDDRLVALLGSDPRLTGLEHRDRRRSMEFYALLEALHGSLAVQYRRAWDISARWISTSSWWPVVFASKRLVQTSPGGFVDALSGCFERIAHAESADLSNGLRLACAAIMLSTLTQHLRGAERSVAPLESALLRGGHSLARALGSSAIGHRLVESEAPVRPDDLALLQPLNVVERSLAVAECVFHLRVKANRAGRVEQERDRRARLAMFDVLSEDWQHLPDWQQIVRKLDGPVFGTWCVSTVNDLLMPLVKRGRLSGPEVVEFWAWELADRWQQLLLDKHHFYVESDPPLTQLVATLIARAWPETSGLIERTCNLFEEAKEILERPFARSTDYGRWDCAGKVMMWIQTFARLVAAEVPPDARLAELLHPASDLPTSINDDPSKLLWFARAVQDQSNRKAAFRADEVLAQLGSTNPETLHFGLGLIEESLEQGALAPERVWNRVVDLVLDRDIARSGRERAFRLLRGRMSISPDVRRQLLLEWAFESGAALHVRGDAPGPIYELLTDHPDAIDELLSLADESEVPPAPDAVRQAILAIQSHLSAASHASDERLHRWYAFVQAHRDSVPTSVVEDIARRVQGEGAS